MLKSIKKLTSQKSYKYVAFGDSHTYGARCDGWVSQFGINGASSGSPDLSWNSFANLFSRHLKKINPNVAYVNAGNPGYATDGALNIVQSQVVNQNPDLVSIEFSLNDWTAGMEIPTFQSNYQNLIDQISTTGAEIFLITPAPAAHTSIQYGWIGTPLSDQAYQLDHYIDTVLSLAESNGLNCVDVYHMFVQQYYRGFNAKYWLLDYTNANEFGGEHPSELGHKMYFNAIKQVLFGKRFT